MDGEIVTRFRRRTLIRTGFAVPLALGACRGAAKPLEEQCKRELLPKLDFPQLGKYLDDNERPIAWKAPVDVVCTRDSITEEWPSGRN